MGADQTPDPTALDDDQLDDLLDALAERAAKRDDLNLPGSGASRRGVLAGLLGLGGAAAGAGVASAIGESESYGNASGVVGTDSEPLNEANVQDLHAQDAQVDNLLEVQQVAGAAGIAETTQLLEDSDPATTLSISATNLSARLFKLDLIAVNEGGANGKLKIRFNGDSTSNYDFKDLDANTTTTGGSAGNVADFSNSRATAVEVILFDGQIGSVTGNVPGYHARQVMSEFQAGTDFRGALAVEGAGLSSFEIFSTEEGQARGRVTAVDI